MTCMISNNWSSLSVMHGLYTQARHAIKYTQLFYIRYTQSLSSECKVNCNIMWNSFILIWFLSRSFLMPVWFFRVLRDRNFFITVSMMYIICFYATQQNLSDRSSLHGCKLNLSMYALVRICMPIVTIKLNF